MQTKHMQFDRVKMRAVILHVCHACDPQDVGAVKLNKVLYFFDMISYAHHRSAVTGATYRKRPNGPTSDQLLFLLRDMERSGDIQVREVDYHGYIKKEYVPLTAEPTGVLNEDELSLLDDVIDFVCCQNTARSISEYSHSLPWDMAAMGGEIPYHSAMLLFPMEPSPEAFDMAEQGFEEIAKARSLSDPLDYPVLATLRGRLSTEFGQSGR